MDKRAWLDTNGPRCIGTHLHDVDGIGDHRAPGRGDVEWDYIAKGLPATALRVFEINQSQPAEAVAGAIGFLRERGSWRRGPWNHRFHRWHRWGWRGPELAGGVCG